MQYARETSRNPVSTAHPLAIMLAFHTSYACSENIRVCDRDFVANNLADFHFSVGKIKILFNRWWRLKLATSAIKWPSYLVLIKV